jgi:hypothetical protein
MPPRSTDQRLEHFDDSVYVADATTLLYKFVDAMCGDAGAGSLKKEIFIQRLSGAISGIYGSDLDYIFGNVDFLSRAPSESYPYDSMTQMLTSDQWDEVEVKDAWYRARITEFFKACSMGGTTDGIRLAVHSAVGVDCDVMENWRYIDNFGLTSGVGRAPVATIWVAVNLTTGFRSYFSSQAGADAYRAAQATPANWIVQSEGPRNEVTIRPLKSALEPKERRLLRDVLDKLTPQDTVVTISTQGLSVNTPIPIRAITSDSSYYEVQKVVTPSPAFDDLPPPELLAIDLDPTEQWLFKKSPELAPYAKFNITQEYGYFYLVSGGKKSPIDSVGYGLLQADGKTVVPETPFQRYETTGTYTAYSEYEIADSPDNYPGGKFGLTPTDAPAVNPDRSPYQFPWPSQQAYIDAKKAEIIAAGGYADDNRYRLPVLKTSTSKRTYTADMAIAYTAPVSDSTVTSSWTARKPRTTTAQAKDSPLVRG